MSDPGVLRVLCKRTNREIYIKMNRFNRDFHEKIPGVTPMSLAVYKASRKFFPRKKPVTFIVPAGVTMPKPKKEEKKVEVVTVNKDTVVEETNSDEMPKKMHEARKWAKEKGMAVTPKTTKDDIKVWVSTNNT